jgi:hypothetical protein
MTKTSNLAGNLLRLWQEHEDVQADLRRIQDGIDRMTAELAEATGCTENEVAETVGDVRRDGIDRNRAVQELIDTLTKLAETVS